MFAKSHFTESHFTKSPFTKSPFTKPRLDLSRLSRLPAFRTPELKLPRLTLPAGLAELPDGTGLPSGLRDMLARLGDLKPGAPLCGTTTGAAPEIAVPAGASFADLTHRGPAGALDYRLYVPAGAAGRRLPLVVMLHGCTQSPEDFAAGTRMNEVAEAEGLLVAYPRQTRTANAQKCWNWFDPKDQARDRGEPALIAGMVRDILRDHAADPSRVYVAGLSAGGAAAAILAQCYPDLFAAVGVHSGLAAGAATDMPGAFAAMRGGGRAAPGRAVPTIVFHGSRDTTVHPVNGEQVAAQAGGGTMVDVAAEDGRAPDGLPCRRRVSQGAGDRPTVEHWLVEGAGHAWSGGSPAGTYTEPRGPDASRAMLRFFLRHRLAVEA